ncbi:Uncharacterised protein [Mycobacterium tuberculosis]|nr:Uncharacterised protein [Mycobacterium tuberculosis]
MFHIGARAAWPSHGEEPEFHPDRLRKSAQIVRITGDHRRLMLHGNGHDDRVHHIGSPGRAAGDAGRATCALVVGPEVASLEHPGNPMLRASTPGLGEDDHRYDRTDSRGHQLSVQREKSRVPPFGGE